MVFKRQNKKHKKAKTNKQTNARKISQKEKMEQLKYDLKTNCDKWGKLNIPYFNYNKSNLHPFNASMKMKCRLC